MEMLGKMTTYLKETWKAYAEIQMQSAEIMR